MKKGQEYSGIVEKIDFPNKGIVMIDGDRIIVKNTIPGQEIRFIVTKIRKGKAEGRLLEVLTKSELETKQAECSHFGKCGGCTYQTITYESQLLIKKNQVQQLLDQVVTIPYEFNGIKGSPNVFAYRNKMEFSFGDEIKNGPLSLGLHKRGSFYDILEISSCKIVDDDYNKILTTVLDLCRTLGLSYYHKMTHEGYLRHLLIRRAASTGEILINLVTSSQWIWDGTESHMLDVLKNRLMELDLNGNIVGILHSVNDSLADVVRSDHTHILYGKEFFIEELMDLFFKISTYSFFQTNTFGAKVLYQTVRTYVEDTKDKIVFDLYTGTGTIAQILAPVAKKVIGIDIVEEAINAAKENALLNGLDNCQFIAGDVLKILDLVEDKPDIIVLDPPRDGIHPTALQKIINYNVERIVYISCKPTSLVRDLEVLQKSGYQVIKVCCVDMFPWTVHVETVVLLSLKSGTPKIEVTMEVDSDSNYSPEEKATYQKIKDYIKDKYGLSVTNLYVAQIKDKCGLDKRLNYNLPKSEDAKKPKCTSEKEVAILDAFKHFGLV